MTKRMIISIFGIFFQTWVSHNIWLVLDLPLWKIFKIETCSKPPTRYLPMWHVRPLTSEGSVISRWEKSYFTWFHSLDWLKGTSAPVFPWFSPWNTGVFLWFPMVSYGFLWFPVPLKPILGGSVASMRTMVLEYLPNWVIGVKCI